MREKKYNEETPAFFRCPELYGLWWNRNKDKPVTTRELYGIVARIAEKVDEAKSTAVWSGWGGY